MRTIAQFFPPFFVGEPDTTYTAPFRSVFDEGANYLSARLPFAKVSVHDTGKCNDSYFYVDSKGKIDADSVRRD